LLNEGQDQGHLHHLLIRLTYIITGIAAGFSIGFMICLLVRQVRKRKRGGEFCSIMWKKKDYYNSFSYMFLGPGSSIAMAFGLLASAMPLAIPVVTGAILAVGAKVWMY
jgi:hypothetical protein